MDVDEFVDLVLKFLQATYWAAAAVKVLYDLWKERKHKNG
jgi:hypothetical protein